MNVVTVQVISLTRIIFIGADSPCVCVSWLATCLLVFLFYYDVDNIFAYGSYHEL